MTLLTRLGNFFAGRKGKPTGMADVKSAGFTLKDVFTLSNKAGVTGTVPQRLAALTKINMGKAGSEAARVNAVKMLNRYGANLAESVDPDDENLTPAQKERIQEAVGRIMAGLEKSKAGNDEAKEAADEIERELGESGEDEAEESEKPENDDDSKDNSGRLMKARKAAFGSGVLKLLTHPSGKVRGPALKGLKKAAAAAKKANAIHHSKFGKMSPEARAAFLKSGGKLLRGQDPEEPRYQAVLAGNTSEPGTPVFSFLNPGTKVRMDAEFKANGGLSVENWFVWFRERFEFCKKTGYTPEEMLGRPVYIPPVALETVAEIEKRMIKWNADEQTMIGRIQAAQLGLDQANEGGDWRSIEQAERYLKSTNDLLARYLKDREEWHVDMIQERLESVKIRQIALT